MDRESIHEKSVPRKEDIIFSSLLVYRERKFINKKQKKHDLLKPLERP